MDEYLHSTFHRDWAVRNLVNPFSLIRDPDCRDVIIEKSCIVGAQPTISNAN